MKRATPAGGFGLSRACTVCKRDHKACDGGRPCSRCVNAGLSALCADVHLKKRGPRKKVVTDAAWGEHRLTCSFHSFQQPTAPEETIPTPIETQPASLENISVQFKRLQERLQEMQRPSQPQSRLHNATDSSARSPPQPPMDQLRTTTEPVPTMTPQPIPMPSRATITPVIPPTPPMSIPVTTPPQVTQPPTKAPTMPPLPQPPVHSMTVPNFLSKILDKDDVEPHRYARGDRNGTAWPWPAVDDGYEDEEEAAPLPPRALMLPPPPLAVNGYPVLPPARSAQLPSTTDDEEPQLYYPHHATAYPHAFIEDPYHSTYREFAGPGPLATAMQPGARLRHSSSGETATHARVNVAEDRLLRQCIQKLVLENPNKAFTVAHAVPVVNDPAAKFFLRIVAANDAACALFDASLEEILLLNERTLAPLSFPVNARTRRHLEMFALSRPNPANAVCHGSAVLLTPQGREVHVFLQAQIFFNQQQLPSMLLFTLEKTPPFSRQPHEDILSRFSELDTGTPLLNSTTQRSYFRSP